MSLKSVGGMIYWHEKIEELWEKPVPVPLVSTRNPTRIDPGGYSGLRGERPVTNHLNHGTAVTRYNSVSNIVDYGLNSPGSVSGIIFPPRHTYIPTLNMSVLHPMSNASSLLRIKWPRREADQSLCSLFARYRNSAALTVVPWTHSWRTA
jgi:hypothetical protein